MTAPPAWIDDRFRLIEAGTPVGWPEIDGRAEPLARVFADAGGAATVVAATVADTVAALVAAERAGVPLVLLRQAGPVDTGGVEPGFAVALQTSGTTGTPKLVRHEFGRLRGRLRGTSDPQACWLLTYEPAAFAGLQVILTALAAGATLVAAPGQGVAALARVALAEHCTHASGTPTFWRALLLAPAGTLPPLAVITLGGEAADQPLLDRLAAAFPGARIRHIYASTEAGALFAVADGRAGFPAAWLDTGVDDVGLRIRDGVLEVRSPRAAPICGDGWLSTGDLVEVAGDRALFAGRLDGRVNIGGVKIAPEAVERRLLAVPGVADAVIVARANPISGHILTADVVPEPGVDREALGSRLRAATAALEPAARPRVIRFADHLDIARSGKKRREVVE